MRTTALMAVLVLGFFSLLLAGCDGGLIADGDDADITDEATVDQPADDTTVDQPADDGDAVLDPASKAPPVHSFHIEAFRCDASEDEACLALNGSQNYTYLVKWDAVGVAGAFITMPFEGRKPFATPFIGNMGSPYIGSQAPSDDIEDELEIAEHLLADPYQRIAALDEGLQDAILADGSTDPFSFCLMTRGDPSYMCIAGPKSTLLRAWGGSESKTLEHASITRGSSIAIPLPLSAEKQTSSGRWLLLSDTAGADFTAYFKYWVTNQAAKIKVPVTLPEKRAEKARVIFPGDATDSWIQALQ